MKGYGWGGEGVPSSLQLFVEGCAVARKVCPGAQRVVAEAEGAGSQCTVAPCSPDLLVSTAGFTGLGGRLLSTLPRGHCHRQSKDTYSPQPWPRGLPCQAQGRQFFLKREVPFTKNERGVGPWRQRAGQSGRQPASLRLMRCPDVPASQPA